jgi:hypothetical protein
MFNFLPETEDSTRVLLFSRWEEVFFRGGGTRPLVSFTEPWCRSSQGLHLLASFWDKKGPYETGVLRQGENFKLIDYHMVMKKELASGKMVPCIFFERVRPQPKHNMKRFHTICAFVKEKIFK